MKDEVQVPEGYEWDRLPNGAIKVMRTPALLFNPSLRYEGDRAIDGDTIVYVIASAHHAYKVRRIDGDMVRGRVIEGDKIVGGDGNE